MSFAQKLLEKYGWKEGDGLGKNNNGISKPLKASLKFDNAGLGVNKADEFNNHWWERVFNEAANNVEIKKDGDKVTVNIKKDESVEITTKDYSVRKLKKKKRDSYDNFILSATLTKTGNEVNKADKIDVDEIKLATCIPLTDEELFAACGGRTAHKGARHGLKLSGKLARIEAQEKKMLLEMQNKTSEVISSPWTVVKDKKKKEKIKEAVQTVEEDSDSKLNAILYTAEYCIKSKKKRKEKKKTEEELSECLGSFSMEKANDDEALLGICDNSKIIKKSKKNKKSKKRENSENFKAYRNPNEEDDMNGSVEKEGNEGTVIAEEVENPLGEIKMKKTKKCKHGIDKEAKEAYKKAKKLKKHLKNVRDDMERSVLIAA